MALFIKTEQLFPGIESTWERQFQLPVGGEIHSQSLD